MRIKDKNRQNLIEGQGGRVNKIHYCLCQIANGPSLIDRSYQPISALNICFTSFSGHGPAQREWARMGLIGPMQGAIPTQSHNPLRLATPPGSTSPTLFEQWCGFFYVPQEQISESAVRRDLRFFVLIRGD